jgi:hypothetical protein
VLKSTLSESGSLVGVMGRDKVADRQRLQRLLEDADGYLKQVNQEQGQVKKIYEDLYMHTQAQIRQADRHQHNAAVATRKFHDMAREVASLLPTVIG